MQKKSGLFLLISWVMAGVGLLLGVVVDSMLFARFGSLVVLFAIISEYLMLHNELDLLYQRLETVDKDDDMPDLTPSKWHRKKVWMAHFTVVLGTLVWGFGDLLLS